MRIFLASILKLHQGFECLIILLVFSHGGMVYEGGAIKVEKEGREE
jgi:hypothetical protein